MGQPYLEPQPFEPRKKHRGLKTFKTFARSSLHKLRGIPQVNMQKLRLPFCIFYLSGECAVCCVAQQQHQQQETNNTELTVSSKLRGGGTQHRNLFINVVDFFKNVISNSFVTCILLTSASMYCESLPVLM